MTGFHSDFHSGFRTVRRLEIPTRWAIMTGSLRGIPMAIPRGFRMAIRSRLEKAKDFQKGLRTGIRLGTPKAIRMRWAIGWDFRRARRLETHSGFHLAKHSQMVKEKATRWHSLKVRPKERWTVIRLPTAIATPMPMGFRLDLRKDSQMARLRR